MNTPKLLPWIAKRAGIDETLALKLWRRASGESEGLAGRADSSDYYNLAMERFLALVEQESGVPSHKDGKRLSWMWRHNDRMTRMGFIATENSYRLWRQHWGQFFNANQKAA